MRLGIFGALVVVIAATGCSPEIEQSFTKNVTMNLPGPSATGTLPEKAVDLGELGVPTNELDRIEAITVKSVTVEVVNKSSDAASLCTKVVSGQLTVKRSGGSDVTLATMGETPIVQGSQTQLTVAQEGAAEMLAGAKGPDHSFSVAGSVTVDQAKCGPHELKLTIEVVVKLKLI